MISVVTILLQLVTIGILLKMFLFVKEALAFEHEEDDSDRQEIKSFNDPINTSSFGLNDELKRLREMRFAPRKQAIEDARARRQRLR